MRATYMINECSEEAIDVVISENRFLEIVFKLHRVIVELLMAMGILSLANGADEFFIK